MDIPLIPDNWHQVTIILAPILLGQLLQWVRTVRIEEKVDDTNIRANSRFGVILRLNITIAEKLLSKDPQDTDSQDILLLAKRVYADHATEQKVFDKRVSNRVF